MEPLALSTCRRTQQWGLRRSRTKIELEVDEIGDERGSHYPTATPELKWFRIDYLFLSLIADVAHNSQRLPVTEAN